MPMSETSRKGELAVRNPITFCGGQKWADKELLGRQRLRVVNSVTGRGKVWQSAWPGTKRPEVQILPP